MKRLLTGLVIALSLFSTNALAAPHIVHVVSTPQYTSNITNNVNETLCLALNIYHEARGSTRQDQVGVAWVTKNRVARSGRSYCHTIWEPRQFSWTPRSSNSLIPREMAAWNRAVTIARQVMSGEISDPTDGAHNFRASHMGGGRGYRVIGAHAYW